MLFNLDEKNFHEALYCSDMALYYIQMADPEPPEKIIRMVYSGRCEAFNGLGRHDDASECRKRILDSGDI